MITWIALSFRRLRDERASAFAFALLVLVTAFLVALAPRVLDRVADETLRAELLERQVAPRSIQLIREDRPRSSVADPLEGPRLEGAALYRSIPPEVRAVIGEQAMVIDSGRFRVTKKLNDPSTIRFRIQPRAEERLHLTAGRLPTATVTVDPVYTLEVAIAAPSAVALRAAIGDVIPAAIDPSDPLVGPNSERQIGAKIVGIFEVDEPEDPWWLGDPGLARPIIRPTGPDSVVLDMLGLLSPEAYPRLLDATDEDLETNALATPVRLTFREYVDLNRIRERDLGTLLPALRKLEALYPSANVPRRLGQPAGANAALRTALRQYLEDHAARWTSALKILSVTAVGPAAVALAALGLAAVFAGRRRRAALSLARGRGASMAQVVVAVLAESLLLAMPAALVAAVAAWTLVPGDPIRPSLALAVAVVAFATVGLLLATVPAVRVAALGGGREAARIGRPSARRLVFEGLVVVLAIVGTAVLRERGIAAASSTGALATADPFVAAVPALAGVAAGLIAVRLVPILIAPFARLARRTRGLVALLALRRAVAGGPAGVLLVLLATSTIGAFSVAALVQIDRAADAVAWRRVGADFSVTTTSAALRARYDFAGAPGVEAAATMFVGRPTISYHGVAPDLAALDVADYERVVAGTPGAAALPRELFGPASQPLPAIVSTALASRPDGIAVGDTVQVGVEGYSFSVRAVAARDSFPGLGDTGLFMLVSRDQLLELFPTAPLQASVAFLRAPATAEAGIRETITAAMPAEIVGSASLVAALRGAPVVEAIRAGIAAAGALAAIYAALAVAAALALAGSARAIELAHLRTLGLADGQASGVLLAEHGPAIVVAFGGGLALGIGLFAALAPGLGLGALVGGEIDVAPAFDAWLLATTAAGVAIVVLLGLGLGILLGRSASPVAALRRGFE